tara:strand:- start:132 stop:299 length:168 start_codon:yes stop_codon:yes gene_type:complete
MVAIFGLLAVAIVLGWLAFELHSVRRSWSYACMAAAGFVLLMLIGAFFGLYGGGA